MPSPPALYFQKSLPGWAWRTHPTLNRSGIGVGEYSWIPIAWFVFHWPKATFLHQRPAEEFFPPAKLSKPRAIERRLFVPRKNPYTQSPRRSGHQESEGPAGHTVCQRPCIPRRPDRNESCELTLHVWQVWNGGFVRLSIHCYQPNADFSRRSNGP